MAYRLIPYVGRNVWVVLLMCGLLACGTRSMEDGLTVEKTDQGYLVREDGADVLFYQRMPRDKNGEYSRSNYVHPLYGLGGEVLTEDFPDDHLHQRGIYWAWHQIYIGERRIGDSWVMNDFSWAIDSVEVLELDQSSDALRIHAAWTSPNWVDAQGNPEPFVDETAVIRVYESEDDMRKVDFEIRLRALTDSVRIGGSEDDKGYGGFSVRMRLPEGTTFMSREGPVTPDRLALERGPWIDISGPLQPGGGTSGLSILCHASNPNYPQPWILRQEDSMQNPVFPGRDSVRLPTTEPLVLRYRVIVHDGGHGQVDLEARQQAYNQEGAVL